VKDFRIRIAVTLLRAAKIRPSASAPRAQPVAKRAVRPELRFAQLRGFRIASERILVLRQQSPCRCGTRNQRGTAKEKS
jgi:hypothetical protein